MSSPLDGNGVALEPCPFCGGEGVVVPVPTDMAADCTDVYVRCQACDAMGPPVLFERGIGQDDPHPEAIALWSRRAPLASQTAVEPVAASLIEQVVALRGLIERVATEVDGQVLAAAAELDAEQLGNPAWLWHHADSGKTTFGRWARTPRQAPYVRADLVIALLRSLDNQGVGE